MALPRLEGTASTFIQETTSEYIGFMALPRLEGTARLTTCIGSWQIAQVSWHCPALRGLQAESAQATPHRQLCFMALPRLEGTASAQEGQDATDQGQGFMALPRLEGTASFPLPQA